MQKVGNPQKKGQHLDFGCGNKLLWLETATSSPGVSLHYEEMIQRPST
jgi:hypothetical protein